jgi:hypothetical protein
MPFNPQTTENRVLAVLRGEQPDRVPVFLYLNPFIDGGFACDPSYFDVMEACRDYEDVIFDWGFPFGFFHTAAEMNMTKRKT